MVVTCYTCKSTRVAMRRAEGWTQLKCLNCGRVLARVWTVGKRRRRRRRQGAA